MSDPYVGEIRLFAGNFAPSGWALCNGALMSIAENETLYNLIGTTYGGDGQTTFGLPNLAGRVPTHMGQGLGLQNYAIGQSGGAEQVTLSTQQLPNHTHTPLVSTGVATTNIPSPGTVLATMGPANATSVFTWATVGAGQANMAPTSIGAVGGSQPHDNMQPTLAINYIIALYGSYPSPS